MYDCDAKGGESGAGFYIEGKSGAHELVATHRARVSIAGFAENGYKDDDGNDRSFYKQYEDLTELRGIWGISTSLEGVLQYCADNMEGCDIPQVLRGDHEKMTGDSIDSCAVVTASWLNIRHTPEVAADNKNGPAIPFNTQVRILDTSGNGWTRVKVTNDNRKGHVSSRYLSVKTPC